MKGQKGSMANGTQEFRGCDNCKAQTCFACHFGRDAAQELEQLPSVHETKFRWNTGR